MFHRKIKRCFYWIFNIYNATKGAENQDVIKSESFFAAFA